MLNAHSTRLGPPKRFDEQQQVKTLRPSGSAGGVPAKSQMKESQLNSFANENTPGEARAVSELAQRNDLHRLHGNWIKRIALSVKSRMRWAEMDDLLQWGAIGMLEATRRYDEERGVDFQAFAARRIRGAMIDGLRREGALRRGESDFDPDVIDTAALAGGISPEDPLAQLVRSAHRSVISEALRTLPPLESKVISLYYYDEMNNREIAAILEISECLASRLRKRALVRLASYLSLHKEREAV